MHKLPPAIFLMGPTASGKTALAIELCQTIPCEIISVDSALIYQHMDIGTAKPTAEELALAPHSLIDFLDPAQSYSVAQFRLDALGEMARITSEGKIPLLVGGTMMYYKVLLEGISPLPEAEPSVRAEIEAQAKISGWPAMHQELQKIDPVSAKRIHPNDPQRLTRALEIYRISGKSMTELSETKSDTLPYETYQFAIAPEDRSILHQRIEQRFNQMITQGFEKEVKKLHQRSDLHLNLPSVRCVGYRQMWEYLDGAYDHDEMVFRAVVATRQLAKRQLTWLRSWKNVTWLDTFAKNNLQLIIKVMQQD